jgi:hypothetical protein
MALDMRLLAVLDKTAGSDRSEPMAVGLTYPHAPKRGDGSVQDGRVRRPTLGRIELPAAGSSLLARDC